MTDKQMFQMLAGFLEESLGGRQWRRTTNNTDEDKEDKLRQQLAEVHERLASCDT